MRKGNLNTAFLNFLKCLIANINSLYLDFHHPVPWRAAELVLEQLFMGDGLKCLDDRKSNMSKNTSSYASCCSTNIVRQRPNSVVFFALGGGGGFRNLWNPSLGMPLLLQLDIEVPVSQMQNIWGLSNSFRT